MHLGGERCWGFGFLLHKIAGALVGRGFRGLRLMASLDRTRRWRKMADTSKGDDDVVGIAWRYLGM